MKHLTLFFIFFALTARSWAESPTNACTPDIQKFCGDKTGPEVFKCLVEKEKSLSTACGQDLQRLAGLYKDAASRGGGLGAFTAVTGGMNLGGSPIPLINYGGSSTFGNGSSEMVQHRLNALAPVYHDGQDSYGVSLSASSLHFGDGPLLDSGTQLNNDFYKIEVGGQFSRQLEGKKNMSARLSAGSASDKPFSDFKDTIFSANASYGYPTDDNSYWMLTVFVSNNNQIANYIPIPGFIYFHRSEHFTGMFGVPFASLQWTPVHPWGLALSLFGPSVNSEITYGDREHVQGFIGYNWTQQSYLRADRAFDKDRLFINEMRALGGVRTPLTANISGELQLGYAFNRQVYEGERFGRHERGRADLDDSWFVQWNARYLFN